MIFIIYFGSVPYVESGPSNPSLWQGGEPGGARRCPLWTDAASLHREEVARAAALARQRLARDNLTLDIDPLNHLD